ncbi:probable E3 ubiquitin-protein ligase DTX2 [Boleophthalmus pectinirostris]|uniref:probable E3 ubiquitin-protein ligase DTX2 n=1 Tax=Boleophthalmus pectinirostris TaxID=150288 RepID=UPI00242D1E53|nr:probable E3 ubiquitin-protein ligase DTX2 [Boleophthalmus pectinirostris]
MAIVSGSCGRVSGPSVPGAGSVSGVLSQPMVVVWEWQDDQGFWRPYSGQVSAYIERCLSPRGQRLAGAGLTSICLGHSDPSLAQYLIDVPGLKQFRQDTGKTRSVRRSLFAQSSGLGSGVYWEWANDDGTWTPYETRTSILLEHSYQARQGTADLGSHGYNYIVDLTSLSQVNKSTGFRRQVRRQCNLPYPLAPSGAHSGASGLSSGASGLLSAAPPGLSSGASSGLSSGATPGVSSGAPPGLSSGAPPGLSSGAPHGLSSGAPHGLSSGAPHGLSSGVPHGLSSGPPPGLTSGSHPGLTSGAHPGLTSGAHHGLTSGAHPGLTSGAHPGLSSGAHPGLSSGAHPGLSSGPPPGISSGPPPGLSSVPVSVSSGPASLLTGPPGTPSSLACSCQQCLSHSSTGPMSSRSRHSFSSGNLTRPSVQSSGRATAAHPTSVYSPYPRRPLSVGSVSWGSPWLPPTAAGHPSTHPSSSFNGMSVPSVSVHLNGSTSVSSALAACAQRPEEVIQRYMEVVVGVPDEDCIICMDQLSNPSTYELPAKEDRCPVIEPDTVGKFIKCGHTLHMLCMLAMYNNGTKDGSLQCPSCKTIYGEKTGTQPKGKMEIYSISQSLPGHPDCGTIQIIYSIPPGIQGPEHPNPGQPYTCRGFPRFCFLPDNTKGRKVLELLKVAWMRRLIFTVGTSSTTGEPDTVVWNGIHHKTEMMSNLSGHGYPDPNYLDNVLSELASQGITEDCLRAHS